MSRKVYDNGQLLEEWDDTTRAYRRYVDGVVAEERPYSPEESSKLDKRDAESQAAESRRALEGDVRAALTTNREYLTSSAPTSAQTAAQVAALTRQVNALIQLVVGE